MSKRTRLSPDDRKRMILNAAVKVAVELGVFNFSITNVSRSMPNTSKATIKHYFTKEALVAAVIEDLLDRPSCLTIEECKVIGQAIAMRHKAVEHIDELNRQEYLKHV